MAHDTEKNDHAQLQKEHAERPTIGGSAAAIIALETAGQPVPFGLSMFDLWCQLTGRSPPRQDTDRFEMGRLLEEPLAVRFQRRTGLTASKVPFLIHPKYDWVTGHMDRSVNEKPADLELKTVEWDRDNEWSDPAIGETTRVPMLYFLQTVWYNGIPYDTGWEVRAAFERAIYMAAQFGFSKPLRIYEWQPDATIRAVHAAMFESCQRFWEEYVLKDTPPPAPGGNEGAVKRWLKYQYPNPDPAKTLIEGTVETVEIARAYKEAKAKADAWKARKDALGNQLAKMIGSSYGIQATLGNTRVKVTWPKVEKAAYMVAAQSYRAIYVSVKGDDGNGYQLGSPDSERQITAGIGGQAQERISEGDTTEVES